METFIIIGGGIVGMSAAYTLAKAGRAVTVIDQPEGGQATDAAGGIICPWLSKRRNKVWYELAKQGARYYRRLTHELAAIGPADTGFKQVGALCLRERRDVLVELADKAAERRGDAPEIGEIRLLSPKQTKAAFPLVQNGFGAVYVSGGARVDGRSLRKALEAGARKNGASVHKGTAVLHAAGGKIDGVICKGESKMMRADRILLAAGAWAKDLLLPIGLTTDIEPQKGQLIHVFLPEEPTGQWPVILPPGAHDIVPFENGRLVVGSTHEKRREGFDLRPTVSGMAEVLTQALQFAPGLKDAAIGEIRVGTRPYTSNFSPFIGQVPGHPELWTANGLGSSGLTTGPLVGCLLAQAAMGEKLLMPIDRYNPEPYFSEANRS